VSADRVFSGGVPGSSRRANLRSSQWVWQDQHLTVALPRTRTQGHAAAAIHASPPQGCARQAITTRETPQPRRASHRGRQGSMGRPALLSVYPIAEQLGFVAASPAPPYECGQLPRSSCANAQLFPQGLCRRWSVVQLPMPGVKHPSSHQQRILTPLPSLALRTSAALFLLVHRVIQLISRPVHQKLHRQQQRHRRPPGDQYRLPRQCRCRRDIRGQRNRDPQQESRPHRAPGPACADPGGLQQADRGQEQEAVHGQRPQRSTDLIRPTLQRELPLMNVRGIRGDPGNNQCAQRPNPRVEIKAPATAGPLRRLGDFTHRTHRTAPCPSAQRVHTCAGTPGNSQVEAGCAQTRQKALTRP